MTNTFNKEGPFDRPLAIATAGMVNAKRWQNKTITFSELSKRLETTVRTNETVDEYRKGSKELRQKAKDQGGFVAGYLKDGKRVAGSVEYRSMLTLDADNAEQDLINRLIEESDIKLIIYTTHGHTPTAPRIRIIIPLKRDVTSDEFNAISRYFADKWGIEQFDPVSFRPMQLMFWPSTPKDGEYVCKESAANDWMDPDKELEKHPDWKDITTLPTLKRENPKRGVGRLAEDPLKKNGIIGAFCRTYTVEEAIEKFLSDVYEPSNIEGRYNYIESSSIAGVLIYDHKWAYSHHASDPAYGKLLNAFDLVRVIEFGNLDTETCNYDNLSSIPISRYPSFKAMEEFAEKDDEVHRTIINESIKSAKDDFGAVDDDWKRRITTKKGNIESTIENLILILSNDDNLQGIAFNELSGLVEINIDVPWSLTKRCWTDINMNCLLAYLSSTYNILNITNTKIAFDAVVSKRKFHPIKDYLESLPQWDGKERVETLFIDYLGAADTAYTRAVTRKTLVAAVARIYEPGIKFDHVLILSGPQGIGKSTIFSRLAGNWFSDALTLTDMRDKTGAEKLLDNWILELSELTGMKKADVESVKSFVTRTDDKFRPSYGRTVESHPRSSIIVGSTNAEGGFLRDITGNRRFWPLAVTGASDKKPWDLDKATIDQIWAETIIFYEIGEDLFLKGNEAKTAERAQLDSLETDERIGIVSQFLDMLLPLDWDKKDLSERRYYIDTYSAESAPKESKRRTLTCNMEIWCECFGKKDSDLTLKDSYMLGMIMQKINGWGHYSRNKNGMCVFPIYGKQRAYELLDKNGTEKGSSRTLEDAEERSESVQGDVHEDVL